MAQVDSPRKPAYFGWYVCAAAVFVGFVAIGARNGLGVFIVPMEAEFGWNRLILSIAGAVGILLNGVTQPFMGRIFDRTGGRRLILASILVIGVTTILLALTTNLVMFIALFGVVSAVAHSGASLTNTSALLARWFRRQRARAIAINSSALSLGGMVMVPFATYLLAATNWRIGWMGLGICVLLALPLAYMFIRESPEKMGLHPDGDPEPLTTGNTGAAARRGGGPLETATWREAFRSAPIWQMSGAYFVCGATTFILSVHFIPYAINDRGLSGGTAALIFALMNGLNIVGALAAGYLSDKVGGTKNWLALVYIMRGVAYLMMLTIPSVAGLWAFAVIAGFSWVATLPLTSSLTADVYGLRAMATISGITFMFHQFGGFASVLLAGWLYDVTGSYTLPFAIAAALLFPAAISAFSIRERKYSVRYQSPPAGAAEGA